MIVINIFFMVVVLLSIATSAEASQKLFKVIEPATLNIYNEDHASIVIKRLKRSLQKVTITVNAKKMSTITTSKQRDVYCRTINLGVGNNKIELTGYTKNNKQMRHTIDIFFRPKLYEGTLEPPHDYKKEFFHTNTNEKQCKSCHIMKKDKVSKFKKSVKKSKINTKTFNVLDDPKKSNCYTCHKQIILKKNRHKPAVNFLCTACHTGKSGLLNTNDKGRSKYLVPHPVEKQCFECHGKIKKERLGAVSVHDTLKKGECNKCHNPHSSDFEFNLRKPIVELCVTCHAEKENGKHVLGSFVFGRNKGSHPVKERKDPSRPGRDLVCSSCHNPHASHGLYLLRTKGTDTYSICQRCHNK